MQSSGVRVRVRVRVQDRQNDNKLRIVYDARAKTEGSLEQLDSFILCFRV